MAKRKTRKFLSNKILLIVAALIIVGIGAALYFNSRSPTNSGSGTKNAPTTAPYVNLQPATEQEKQQSQAAKDAIAAQQNQTPASSSGKKQVTPVIAHADGSSVSAYVGGVLEDGGTCTATFTKGSTVKTFTSQASANVSYTTCGAMTVTGLTSGAWQLVVSYSSSTSAGSSQPQTVNIY